jgi:hypothetical protein
LRRPRRKHCINLATHEHIVERLVGALVDEDAFWQPGPDGITSSWLINSGLHPLYFRNPYSHLVLEISSQIDSRRLRPLRESNASPFKLLEPANTRGFVYVNCAMAKCTRGNLIFPDGNVWPYGLNANRATLDPLLVYCYEQGITARLLKCEELFAPEVNFEVRV